MPPRLLPDASTPEVEAGSKPNEAAEPPRGDPLVSIDSSIFKEVNVALQAKLGATLSVEELLALKPGSVVTLDLKVNDLVELRLNGSLVARGEIVAVGDHFGVRVVEIGQIP